MSKGTIQVGQRIKVVYTLHDMTDTVVGEVTEVDGVDEYIIVTNLFGDAYTVPINAIEELTWYRSAEMSANEEEAK
jgi:hypothetical protein